MRAVDATHEVSATTSAKVVPFNGRETLLFASRDCDAALRVAARLPVIGKPGCWHLDGR